MIDKNKAEIERINRQIKNLEVLSISPKKFGLFMALLLLAIFLIGSLLISTEKIEITGFAVFDALISSTVDYYLEPYVMAWNETTEIIRLEAVHPVNLTIEYGETPSYGSSISNSTFAAKHEALITGLNPDTLYYYKVKIINTSGVDYYQNLTFNSSFRTSKDSKTHFSFAVLGDSRGASCGELGSNFESIIANISAKGVDFVIMTGDDIQAEGCSNDDSYWQGFHNVTEIIRKNTSLLSAIGNHEDPDRTAAREAWRNYWIQPLNGAGAAGHWNETTFSWRYGNSLFIFVNTEEPGNSGDIAGSQFTWFNETALTHSGYSHKFVFGHKPLIGSSRSGNLYNENPSRSAKIDLEMYSKNVTAAFYGHDHYYCYNTTKDGEMLNIITGGGGAPLYTTDTCKGTGISQYHYIIVNVSTQKINATVYNLTGDVIHTFGRIMDTAETPIAQSIPILNSTSGRNLTIDNLTVHYSFSDPDSKPIINWSKNGISIAVLNMPFEIGSNSTYAKDYSGLGNNANIFNGIWNSGGGYDLMGAYEFDGTTYFEFGNDSSLSVPNNISIELWLKQGTPSIISPSASSWGYKRMITLNPSTPGDNYSVKIELNTSNFDYTQAKSDGSDIRFYDFQNNKLGYWIEGWNYLGNSTIWVNVKNSGTSAIYMIYNNSAAGSESNGTAAFDLFDDFEDLDAWDVHNGPPYTLYECTIINTINDSRTVVKFDNCDMSRISSKVLIDYPNISIRRVLKGFGGTADVDDFCGLIVNKTYRVWRHHDNFIDKFGATTGDSATGQLHGIWNFYNSAGTTSQGAKTVVQDWRNHTINKLGSNISSTYDDETISITPSSATGYGYVQILNDADTTGRGVYIDFILVRKISVSEPAAELKDEIEIDSNWIIQKNGSYKISSNSSHVFASVNNNEVSGKLMGEWNHIVMTYNGLAQKIYINSELNASSPLTEAINPTSSNLIMGYFYNGTIDEVRIYNLSLSAEQIKALYENKTDSIVFWETKEFDIWQACVTPVNSTEYGETNCSNTLQVKDLLPPQINIITPQNNTANLTDNNIFFSYYASDGSDIANCTLIINNEVNQTDTSITNFGLNNFTSYLANGQYNWSINCTDLSSHNRNGTSGVDNLTVDVDLIPPNITIISPLNNTINYTNNTITFTYNASDEKEISSCSLIINSTLNQTDSAVENNKLNYFTVYLENAQYSWSINCTDNNSVFQNNESSGTYSITVDVPPPRINISLVTPISNTNFTKNAFSEFTVNITCNSYSDCGEINATISQKQAGAGSWEIIPYSGEPFWTNTTNPYTLLLNKLESSLVTFWINSTGSELKYELLVYANKTSNMSVNNKTDIINISIKELPTIGLISPANNTRKIADSEVTFIYNVIDSTGIENCSLIINNAINLTNTTVENNHYNTFTQSFENGQYNWSIKCIDNSSFNYESITASFNLTIDIETNPPNITIISPANSSTYPSNDVQFNYNVSDETGIANCSLIINGAVDQTSSSITNNTQNSFTKTLPNSQYNWSINCTDSSSKHNKASSGTYILTVSYTPPVTRRGGGGRPRDKCADVNCGTTSISCWDGSTPPCINTCDSATGMCIQCSVQCPVNPCDYVECKPTTRLCWDDSTASCTNTCNPFTARCSRCTPSCPEPPEVEEPLEIMPPPSGGGCTELTERVSSASLRTEKVPLIGAVNIPKNYEIIKDPFRIDCMGDSFFMTFNIPSDYVDIKAIKCYGGECLAEVKTVVEKEFRCGEEFVVGVAEEKRFIPPEEVEFILTEEKSITEIDSTIASGKNRITFMPTIPAQLLASVQSPESVVFHPDNPQLTIVGTPITAKITTDSSYLKAVITLPYTTTGIEEDSIAVYASGTGSREWSYLGGVLNKDEKTVSVEVENIINYLDSNNEAMFAVMGVKCEYCEASALEKVYHYPGSRDAVVFVHGMGSSPSTFDEMISEFMYNEQPWQIWTFGYSSSIDIETVAVELAELLESRSIEYDNLYIVAHSLGGMIIQEALHHSNINRNRFTYLDKARKTILIATPNEGTPGAEVYRNLYKYLVNFRSRGGIFNVNSKIIDDLVSGKIVPRVEGVDYYVIAGTKTLEFNVGVFKIKAEEFLEFAGKNDGLITVNSAQNIGGEYVNDMCKDYWEIDATHTDIIDITPAIRVIQRILSDSIAEAHKEKALLGYNQYFRLMVDQCSPYDTYILIGRKIRKEKIYDELNCLCGNGFCGEGEDEYNCPVDCARILTPENIIISGPIIIYSLCLVGFLLSIIYITKKHLMQLWAGTGWLKAIITVLFFSAVATVLYSINYKIHLGLAYFAVAFITVYIITLEIWAKYSGFNNRLLLKKRQKALFEEKKEELKQMKKKLETKK